jgi:hypothetical protein
MNWSSETLMQSFVSPQYIYSLKDCSGSSLLWRLPDATHSQEQKHSRRVEWAKIVSDNAESKFFRWPHSLQKIFQYCAEQIGRLNHLMVAPKSHIFLSPFLSQTSLLLEFQYNSGIFFSRLLAGICQVLIDTEWYALGIFMLSGPLMSMSLQSFDFSAF